MKNERCAGCAFTKGTEANSEPQNHIKGLICMLTPVPFYCHSTFDYKDEAVKEGSRDAQEVRKEIRTRGMKICEGWRESCAKLAETGYYREKPKETKVFGKIALATLIEIQDGEGTDAERKKFFDRLGAVFEKLSEKWKKFQNKSIGVGK